MVDKKLTELDAITAVTSDDLIYVVNDPTGTAVSKKIRVDDFGSTAVTPIDGWINPNETWTYASATTFTIVADKTAIYQVGTKLRLKQGGGYIYAYVLSSSYGAPNTTVTLVVNSDYSLANAGITDNYFSYIENPRGFPVWLNFTPTYTSTSGTPTTVTTTRMLFRMQGPIILGQLKITITNKGTAAGGIRIATPFTWSDSGFVNGYLREDSLTGVSGSIRNSTTYIELWNYINTTLWANNNIIIGNWHGSLT